MVWTTREALINLIVLNKNVTIKSTHYNNKKRLINSKWVLRNERERENKNSMINIIEDIIGNKKKRETLLKIQNDSKSNSKYL